MKKVFLVSYLDNEDASKFVDSIRHRVPNVSKIDYFDSIKELIKKHINIKYGNTKYNWLVKQLDILLTKYNDYTFNKVINEIHMLDTDKSIIFILVNGSKRLNKLKRFIRKPKHKTIFLNNNNFIHSKGCNDIKNYTYDYTIDASTKKQLNTNIDIFISSYIPSKMYIKKQ